ncbi:MAG: ABA4-like family protein [Pseudohongiella sp.]|nr:ABA4-like family protein [Pseudohongiella sp.]
MSPDQLFLICNFVVLPAWLLLAIVPHHRITQLLVHAIWMPLLLGPFYVWALFFGEPAAEGAGFGSLQGVMLLFQSPTAVLGGWIHYLVFDLFIGAWIVRDAKRQGINHWLTVPFLFMTLLAGPAGLMLYLMLRLVLKRSLTLIEAA